MHRKKSTAGNTGKGRTSNKLCTDDNLAYLLCLPLQELSPLLLLPLHIPDSGEPPRQKAHPLPMGSQPCNLRPSGRMDLSLVGVRRHEPPVGIPTAIMGSSAGLPDPTSQRCGSLPQIPETPEGGLFTHAPLPSRAEQYTGWEGGRNLESGTWASRNCSSSQIPEAPRQKAHPLPKETPAAILLHHCGWRALASQALGLSDHSDLGPVQAMRDDVSALRLPVNACRQYV